MSDRMTMLPTDERLLELVDHVARAGDLEAPGLPPPGREERGVVELLGLLALVAEPIPPRPDARSRLLAKAAASRSAPAPRPTSISLSPAGIAGRWAMPLAAGLVVALLGINGWMAWQLAGTRAQVARLEEDLGRAGAQAGELALVHEALAEARSRLDLLTGVDTEYCPLRPPERAGNPGARGTVVMQSGRSEWLLQVVGLEPLATGREYRLWFLTEGGPVAAASFAIEAGGETVRVHGRGLPPAMTGVMITAEAEGAEKPSAVEPPVLFGAERIQVL